MFEPNEISFFREPSIESFQASEKTDGLIQKVLAVYCEPDAMQRLTSLGCDRNCDQMSRAPLQATQPYCGWIAPLIRAVSRPVHLLPGGTLTLR